ncbi:MAG: LUD domain-containing protein [Lacibacter sp.]|jgi:L-lactate dehydrogenase complex protein LldG
MSVSPAKENILKKIRQALSHPVPVPFPQSEGNNSVFQPPVDDMAVQFAQEFTRLQGRFVYCADAKEAVQHLLELVESRAWSKLVCREKDLQNLLLGLAPKLEFHNALHDSDASITSCELLISRTGSILLSNAYESGRTASVYAPVHICIAFTHQLVYDIKDGLVQLKEKYGNNLPSFISLATGPSRTADIEKTLVVGVHGPKEVFVFLIETPSSI